MAGRTCGGGTGSTVNTIQSGLANFGLKPRRTQSSLEMFLRISYAFSANRICSRGAARALVARRDIQQSIRSPHGEHSRECQPRAEKVDSTLLRIQGGYLLLLLTFVRVRVFFLVCREVRLQQQTVASNLRLALAAPAHVLRLQYRAHSACQPQRSDG